METSQITLHKTVLDNVWRYLYDKVSSLSGKSFAYTKLVEQMDGTSKNVTYRHTVQGIQPPQNNRLVVKFTYLTEPEGESVAYSHGLLSAIEFEGWQLQTDTVLIKAEFAPYYKSHVDSFFNDLIKTFEQKSQPSNIDLSQPENKLTLRQMDGIVQNNLLVFKGLKIKRREEGINIFYDVYDNPKSGERFLGTYRVWEWHDGSGRAGWMPLDTNDPEIERIRDLIWQAIMAIAVPANQSIKRDATQAPELIRPAGYEVLADNTAGTAIFKRDEQGNIIDTQQIKANPGWVFEVGEKSIAVKPERIDVQYPVFEETDAAQVGWIFRDVLFRGTSSQFVEFVERINTRMFRETNDRNEWKLQFEIFDFNNDMAHMSLCPRPQGFTDADRPSASVFALTHPDGYSKITLEADPKNWASVDKYWIDFINILKKENLILKGQVDARQVIEPPLPEKPQAPKRGSGIAVWFDYYHDMKKANYKISFKDLAELSGYSANTFKQEHGRYKSERGID